MKKRFNSLINLGLRYSILVLFGVLGVGFFHIILYPLTIYPVLFLLKLFFDASLISNILLIEGHSIEIIGPCLAGSAYYLLLILNLSTPKIKNRINLLIFSLFVLLLINILRIFTLSVIFVSGSPFFDLTHKLFWYFGSTIFVVGIWFLGVKIFNVKKIPFYSDIKFLFSLRKKIKKSKSSNKH